MRPTRCLSHRAAGGWPQGGLPNRVMRGGTHHLAATASWELCLVCLFQKKEAGARNGANVRPVFPRNMWQRCVFPPPQTTVLQSTFLLSPSPGGQDRRPHLLPTPPNVWTYRDSPGRPVPVVGTPLPRRLP